MSETTCPHGFPSAASCFDCIDEVGLGATPVEPETMVVQLTARFDTDCPECLVSIHRGDSIVETSRNRYLHARCCVGVLS